MSAHTFLSYPNPALHKDCVRCGKPEAAHDHPELKKAAFVSALDRSKTAYSEGDQEEAVRQLEFARRIARGES